jgi:hypothetical protein
MCFEQTFDFAEPPAPIEVHTYGKRAGEIIARGAAGSQGALGGSPHPAVCLIERRSPVAEDVSDCARPAPQVREFSRLILLFHRRTIGRLPGVAWIQ